MANSPASSPSLPEAWQLMHFALRAVIAEPDRMLAVRNLTRVHHRVLFFVAREPGISVGALQATLGVSKQALAAPLRTLVQQGLIAIRKADHDARVRHVHLTRAGRTLETQLTGAQYAMFEAAFAAAGPEAVAGWTAIMRHLAAPLAAPVASAGSEQGRERLRGP